MLRQEPGWVQDRRPGGDVISRSTSDVENVRRPAGFLPSPPHQHRPGLCVTLRRCLGNRPRLLTWQPWGSIRACCGGAPVSASRMMRQATAAAGIAGPSLRSDSGALLWNQRHQDLHGQETTSRNSFAERNPRLPRFGPLPGPQPAGKPCSRCWKEFPRSACCWLLAFAAASSRRPLSIGNLVSACPVCGAVVFPPPLLGSP